MGLNKKLAFFFLTVMFLHALTPVHAGQSDFRILLFTKTSGFTHGSIPDAITAIQQLGSSNNFQVDQTEDASAFNATNLAQYQAVVFLMTTGDVLNASQQQAFETYIGNGGGFAGVHSASDTEYSWPWYGNLVGAYFDSHPAQQNAVVNVESATHPSMQNVPAQWSRFDEWYNFQTNPRNNPNIDVTVLATIDESSYNGGNMGADHPLIWYHPYAGGRSWYTAMGHTSASYSDPDFLAHLLGGIQYAAGVAPADPIVVDETNQWFKKQNSDSPFYMSGVGGPEGFLYESDTRKQEIVDDLIASGANALYMHSIRSFQGDGYDYEDPFVINNDVSSGIRPGVFANWRSFLTQLDQNGIVTWMHVIDDTARPWGCSVPLSQDAKDYIEALVTAFRDLDHLVWLSGEEFLMGSCTTAQDIALMKAIAAEIRLHDTIHPIGVHHNNGQAMQFDGDPNINVFAQQICGAQSVRSPEGVHNAAERGDWVYVMAECHPWHLDLLHSNDRQMIRQSNWGTALAGGYMLLYNAYECAHAGRLCSRDSNGDPTSANDPHDPSTAVLGDLNRLREFMQSSRFNELTPNDALATADTLWVTADTTVGLYVLYAKDNPTSMGVSGIGDVAVRLNWFDPLTGNRITQDSNGNAAPYAVPAGFGAEAAVFIERTGEVPNRAPMSFADNYIASANQTLQISAPGVLGNDFDPDNDPITAILVEDVAQGVLNLNSNGGFSYAPPADFTGLVTFTYKANDGDLDSSDASVNLQVVDDSNAMQAWLINAVSDTRVRLLQDGEQININTLSFQSFSIEAENVPAGTLSVSLAMTGPISNTQVEGVAPYALFGDTNGDFNGEDIQTGAYVLTLKAFDAAGGSGNELADVTINFSFDDASDLIFANSFE